VEEFFPDPIISDRVTNALLPRIIVYPWRARRVLQTRKTSEHRAGTAP
jgi:hypothetical protein